MAILAAITALPRTPDAETLRVGGTGMALATMRELAQALTARDAAFKADILPSLGSTGGLLALAHGAVDVAVTARPLTAAEAQHGIRVAACATTPFIFVTSLPTPQRVNRSDLAALFGNPAAAWSDGSPVRIVLRTRDDTDNAFLINNFPGMKTALERARRRPDVPSAASDQDNAELAQKIPGSLAALTLMQLTSEGLDLRAIAVDGVAPSAAALDDRSYPFAKTMCLVLPRRSSAAAELFIAFVRSGDGERILRGFGAIPSASDGF